MTNENPSTHKRVINAIHDNWFSGEPFAVREVRQAAGVSESTAIRILKRLVEYRFLSYSVRAFAGKHYRVTMNWSPRAKGVIEAYEIGKAMKI